MSREIELRAPHLLALLGLVAAAAAGGWFLLRGDAEAGGTAVAVGGARGGAQAPPVETLQESVFDRDAAGAERRGPSALQVTPEIARGGAYEIDLGAFPTRTDAERARAAAIARAVPTGVATAADGSYVVVAGPFRTEEEARAALSRLAAVPGLNPRLVAPGGAPPPR